MNRRRADMLLVARGLFDSRARAQAAIAAGGVSANGLPVRKPSEMLADDAVITAQAAHPYVSRGGLKLAAALDHFGIDPEGRTCLDVGASTGGFSDVLLRRGAAHVMAIDSGRQQLHGSLAGHPRLTSREGTDVRDLPQGALEPKPDLAVIDVSFIPLGHVLGAVTGLVAPRADLIALIKPQFEVGRAAIGKNGLVKDEAARAAACEGVLRALGDLGWQVAGIIRSPITGGDGNIEYLAAAKRG